MITIGGGIPFNGNKIRVIIYADDIALLAEYPKMLQDMMRPNLT